MSNAALDDKTTAILAQCRDVVPGWRALSLHDFSVSAPKGFSSFTLTIRANPPADPQAVIYRRLAGKENAILDFEDEKAVFLLLGTHQIAPTTYFYDETCRIESFYSGRTLTAADLSSSETLRGIAGELHRFHQLQPAGLPDRTFFELLFEKWGALAERFFSAPKQDLPPEERAMCRDLREITHPTTLEKIRSFLPASDPVFCHNDTFHGNIMRLDTGEIRLLDFEFSCLNHRAFDFSNLFAETVMVHHLPHPPHFRIAAPAYTDREIDTLIGHYLDHFVDMPEQERDAQHRQLSRETKELIPLSDFMYALAALPLALEPIQKIRFIPYAHQRFTRFKTAYRLRFGK